MYCTMKSIEASLDLEDKIVQIALDWDAWLSTSISLYNLAMS